MKKGILQIFFSNLVFLIFGLLNNFFLPKYLSVDSYALLKTYMLYISYATFLGFGYIEGSFLKYGGKDLARAKEMGCGKDFNTFLVIELFVAILVIGGGLFLDEEMYILLGIGFFITNIINYLKNFFTAIGEFKIYSVINSMEKILVLVFNMVFLLLFKTDDYRLYCIIIIGVAVIEIIYVLSRAEIKSQNIFSDGVVLREAPEMMKMGILLLLGNGLSGLFTAIDQWFVKFLMTSADFAMYAFAASLERVVTVFISPITAVLYNFFCKTDGKGNTKFVSESIAIWGFGILIFTFPAKFVVRCFLPNYVETLNIIAILFCGQALNCVINGVYINVLKAQKKQKMFLWDMVIMLFLAIVLNAIFYSRYNGMLAFAVATLITKIIWLIRCQWECKEYRYSKKTNIAIVLYISVLIATSYIPNDFLGAGCYILIFVMISILFIRDSFFRLLKELINVFGEYVRSV